MHQLPQVPQLRRNRDDEGTVIYHERPLVRATRGLFLMVEDARKNADRLKCYNTTSEIPNSYYSYYIVLLLLD